MAHEVRWIIENRVLLNRYTDIATSEDILSTLQKNGELIQTVNETFYIFFDLEDIKRLDAGFFRLPKLINISRDFLRNPKLWGIIGYGNYNPAAVFLARMLMTVTFKKFRFVDTYDEALSLVVDEDDSLKELVNQIRQP